MAHLRPNVSLSLYVFGIFFAIANWIGVVSRQLILGSPCQVLWSPCTSLWGGHRSLLSCCRADITRPFMGHYRISCVLLLMCLQRLSPVFDDTWLLNGSGWAVPCTRKARCQGSCERRIPQIGIISCECILPVKIRSSGLPSKRRMRIRNPCCLDLL